MRRAFVALILLLVACGDDESRRIVTPEPLPYDLTTRDGAVAALEYSLENLDLALFDQLLHEDFRFEFATADIAASGTPNGIWERAQEMASIGNMFSGAPGSSTPGVKAIITTWTAIGGSWVAATEPELLGSWRRSFELDATVVLTTQARFQINGVQDLYLLKVDDQYQIFHWRDQGITTKQSVEEQSWGAVQSLY